MIKLLVFSTLYPNQYEPRHGIFVEQRLRKLMESGEVTAKVVAPVPWFPFKSSRFGRYGVYAKVPRVEQRHGITIMHPRFPSIPKVGMGLKPAFVEKAVRGIVRDVIAQGYDFDVIDSHYFYPDGVAAVRLGAVFNKPVVVTCRGSDVMIIPDYPRSRQLILEASQKAAAIVTVSADLKKHVCALGVPEKKVTVLRNGVDTQFFCPVNREVMRQRLGLTRRTLLSVGNLIELKGHHIVLEALKDLPDYELVIIGQGSARGEDMSGELRRLVKKFGLSARVRFMGNLPQDALKDWYGAADALVLATRSEGMPNVVLESFACGTPVIATSVGGIPEIVTQPAAGILISERTPAAVAKAVRTLFQHLPDRQDTRAMAQTLSWDATTKGQIELFNQVLLQARDETGEKQVQQA